MKSANNKGKNKPEKCEIVESNGPWGFSENTDGTLAVAQYTEDDGSLFSIPDTIAGGKVTSIMAGAFSGNEDLKSVYIPEGITEIGNGAFEKCAELTSIRLPNSLIKIGESAFAECPKLNNVIIRDSVTTIEKNAFLSCKALNAITIPNSVTKLGEGVFRGCNKLETITLPNSITKIPPEAMDNEILNEKFTLEEVVLPQRACVHESQKTGDFVSAFFRGYNKEIERLSKHLPALSQVRLEKQNDVNDTISELSFITDQRGFFECIEEFPCLKATGIVAKRTEAEVFYSDSGYGYLTEWQNAGFFIKETELNWIFETDPTKDYLLKDAITPFAYTFPYKTKWKDNNYYLKKDDKFYLIHILQQKKKKPKTVTVEESGGQWGIVKNGDGTVSIVACKKMPVCANIPEENNGRKITRIRATAFKKMKRSI